ncbi:hypothetical protein ACFYNY_35865 [Streptomyces sp. NPDC006530]|uniref:hypothetical protein n=1 Tax=Streptomyces sp. NPDC006530 TaxID=3364750 RepID=UPI0036984FB3
MPPNRAEPRVHEIRIQDCADTEEAVALQEPVERLLCPDPDHEPPCPIPWSFSLAEQTGGPRDTSTTLILGVYAAHGQATQVARQVRALVGEGRPVLVREGDPEDFEELVEQYRIERGMRRS